MRVLIILLLATMVFQPLAARAQSPEALALLKALTSDLTGAKWRANYASSLRTFCAHMAAKVPHNTPTEDAWVQKETLDGVIGPGASQARMDRLDNSEENARFILQSTFSSCVKSTGEILQAVPGSKQEAAHWAELVWQLGSAEHVRRSAARLGLYTVSPFSDPDGLSDFQTVQQIILKYGLIPLLKE
ncbi:hypothetical protein [Bradyrhizobium sp. McL0616]|uniref:hypothetical protein n=1 Tax=Bradyrhizobium sp. McL0616 TaxID=3415674 RepID=UPI003CE802C2